MLNTNVNATNFNKEVLENEKVVLLDFFGTWCGPCRMLSPILDQIATERDDIDVIKIDIDKEPELAMKYNVMSVPNMLIIKDGKVVNRAIGAIPKQKILELISYYKMEDNKQK